MTTTASISADVWQKFFASCGIPDDVRAKYAQSFVKQRISPHLLRDLGKEDLRELGIKTLGDQLDIIHYVKQCDGTPPEFGGPIQSKRRVVKTKPIANSDEDEPMDEAPPLSKAPDRHDVYHIRMPEGKLPRTRNILDMNDTLRDQGLIKRGVSGVRRSGVEMLRGVSSQSKSIVKRSPTKPAALVVQDTGISSSSTAGGRIPAVGTMRSDALSTKTIVVKDANSPIKRDLSTRFGTLSTVGAGAGRAGAFQVQREAGGPRRVLPSQRSVVNYADKELMMFDEEEQEEDQTLDEMEEALLGEQMATERSRRPITERIQLIQGAGGGRRRLVISGAPTTAAGSRRRRPVVTVGGRKINLPGGAPTSMGRAAGLKGRVAGGSRRAQLSILDRISLA